MMGRLRMKMVNYRLHVPTYATSVRRIALPPLPRRGLAFVKANHVPAMLDGGGQAVQAHHMRLRRLSRHRQRSRVAFADLAGDAAVPLFGHAFCALVGPAKHVGEHSDGGRHPASLRRLTVPQRGRAKAGQDSSVLRRGVGAGREAQ